MDISCNYSFWDLFQAANKRPPTKQEKEKFLSLTQVEKNTSVTTWAAKAKWKTEERVGTDGERYVAFFPSLQSA